MLKKFLTAACLFASTSMLHAQATATASRRADVKVGGGFTFANSDYGGHYKGAMGFLTYDFTGSLGIEGNFHFVKGGGNLDLYEKTYEIGGRYFRNYHDDKLSPYVKLLYGRGVFNFPAYIPSGPHPNLAYNMGVIGGGLDYKFSRHLYFRGDFEYQRWFHFPPSGLSPTLFTVGAAYHF